MYLVKTACCRPSSWYLWKLPVCITPIILLCRYIPMLIFRQKSFKFCTPRLKTWQPVLPYSALWSKTFCWTKALQFLWSDFYWLSQSLIFLCCNFYFLSFFFFCKKKLLLFFVLMQFDWARHYLDPWELCWKICISPILLFSLALDQVQVWCL